MKRERATKKQQELLQYIRAFLEEHDYSPSYREIMNALGYKSVSTVAVHVNALVAKGYLERRDGSARSLEVVSATSPQSSASLKAGLAAAIKNEIKNFSQDTDKNIDKKRGIDMLIEAHELLHGKPQTAELRELWGDNSSETDLA